MLPQRLERHSVQHVARECVNRGAFLSFAGVVTFKNAQSLRDALAVTPLDRILVETDAPYLTPQDVRKERNQPSYVTYTAEFVAEARGATYGELEAAVERNAAEVFGW